MTIQNTISTPLQASTDATVNITTCNIPITAIDPPMRTDITPIHTPTTVWNIPALRDQSNTDAQLAIILERVCRYFYGRVDTNDIQALSFGLHHLFCYTAKLYQNVLPELTFYAIQARQSEDILITYGIWDQLQAIDGLFKRIESHCHLLTSTIPTILDALEHTCRAQSSLTSTTCAQSTQSSQEDSVQRQAHFATTQENTLAHLNAQLRIWQQSNEQRLIFAQQFADQPTVRPALAQVDTALNILQEHTNAIFSRIVPDFLSLGVSDDETTTVLLLDLIQKADELQFYMGTQLEPFCTLLQPQQTRSLVHTSSVFSG